MTKGDIIKKIINKKVQNKLIKNDLFQLCNIRKLISNFARDIVQNKTTLSFGFGISKANLY